MTYILCTKGATGEETREGKWPQLAVSGGEGAESSASIEAVGSRIQTLACGGRGGVKKESSGGKCRLDPNLPSPMHGLALGVWATKD